MPAKPASTTELVLAYDEFATAVADVGDVVEQHRWYGSDLERAEAYRHITRVMMNVLPERLLIDPDFPYFYEIGPFSKNGMDNPDQRYLSTLINGDGVYRVWGFRGSSRRLDFSLYDLDAMSATLSALTSEDLEVGSDGRFELIIGGPRKPGNWMPLPAGTKRLLVRQVFSDWRTELPGEVHIDRIDAERPRYPSLSEEEMARRLRDAAELLRRNVQRWPDYSQQRFAERLPVNTLSPPRTVSDSGGLAGRVMIGGHFELTADEALLVKAWPTDAGYQGIQLASHWWASLDYENRQSSLNLDQAHVSSDGALYFVISGSDPGARNWLDTEGFSRGVLFFRYDGLSTPTLPADQIPTVQLVALERLREFLPDDDPVVTPVERTRIIEERRRHVQRRFGL